MVGPSNASNRFGPSSYVVGTPANGLGNGVNFTSIQSAIAQAVADGYGIGNPTTIIIRPGTYSENIAMVGGIALQGAEESPFSFGIATTTIDGSVTCTSSPGAFFLLSNLNVQNPTGPALTLTGAITLFFAASDCTFSSLNANDNGVLINNLSGTFSIELFDRCNISGDDRAILATNRNAVTTFRCILSAGNVTAISLDNTCRWNSYNDRISSTAGGVILNAAANVAEINYGKFDLSSAVTCFDTTAGGTVNIRNSTILCDAASGFWIEGTGNLSYADIINEGTAIAIDPGLGTITAYDWKPYAEAGASPGTGVVRGTSAFDSSQLTPTDGFVSFNPLFVVPARPGFHAFLPATDANVTGNGSTYTLGSGNALTIRFDQGSNFTTGGVFTAPVTGLYWFNFRVTAGSLLGANSNAFINVVTTTTTYEIGGRFNPFTVANASNEAGMQGGLFCQMNAADTATFTLVVTGGGGANADVVGDAGGLSTFVMGWLVQ